MAKQMVYIDELNKSILYSIFRSWINSLKGIFFDDDGEKKKTKFKWS